MRRHWFVWGFLVALLALPVAAEDAAQTAKDPVTGRPVKVTKETARILVNGKPVYFEDEKSREAFAKQPEKYLTSPFPCPVLTTEMAPSKQLRLVVNDTLWYFCCGDCPATALGAPAQYFKRLTDPVNGKEFVPTENSPHSIYRGSHYFFSQPESKAKFDQDPSKFARILANP